MGRLSEYINGYRGRHSVYGYNSPRYNPRTGSLQKGGDNGGPVQVDGVEIVVDMLGNIMTTHPSMAGDIRKVFRRTLREARKRLSQDAKNYMRSDPRKAHLAVNYAVKKVLLEGNVNILKKKKGKAGRRSNYTPPRTSRPGQLGGNRIARNTKDNRNRLDQYYGADRGFVLRFIASGTVRRNSRYGNRGIIPMTNWFGHTAPWEIETAAAEVAAAITEYINNQTNG